MKHITYISFLIGIYFTPITAQKTSLDNLIRGFRIYRKIFDQFIDQDIRSETYARDIVALDKTQKVLDPSVPFPCVTNGFRSKEKPESVHKLRPGDIDVIGAMGDSLTAGIGALSTSLVNLYRDYRGVTFLIGGQKTWREYLTIPNILKEFNPNLIGYSLGTSTTLDYASQFNVAEALAMSRDLHYMAKVLIKRMVNDKRVDINNDWKMISIFIGPNDFCGACFDDNPEDVLTKHKESLVKTLRMIKFQLPRTFINLVSLPHLQILQEVTSTANVCEVAHRVSCPCMFGDSYNRDRPKLADINRRWQLLEEEIANYDEFNQDNFTVVWQPMFVQPLLPRKSNGEVDTSFLSSDCFHFSQKGHALSAKALWNDIISPVGRKPTTLFSGDIKCPTIENPYLFTKSNSNVPIR